MFGIGQGPGRIYINPSVDTIYFGPRDGYAASQSQLHTFMSRVAADDLRAVHQVAINETLIPGCYTTVDGRLLAGIGLPIDQVLLQVCTIFSQLEQLTIVWGDNNPIYSTDSVFAEPRIANRLIERRIRKGIQAIEEKHTQWKPPAWKVMGISSDPNAENNEAPPPKRHRPKRTCSGSPYGYTSAELISATIQATRAACSLSFLSRPSPV
jgi:hypothetical protein